MREIYDEEGAFKIIKLKEKKRERDLFGRNLQKFFPTKKQTKKNRKTKAQKNSKKKGGKRLSFSLQKDEREGTMDSVSRQTPRHQRIVNVKRRRSEDDAFNDEEDDECGDAEFSLRNPPLTDGQKAPSTAFNSMKILASSTNAKTTSSHQRSRKKPPNHLLQLRQTHHHQQQQQQQQQPSSCSVGRSVRMQRFESTSNTTTRNIAKQMMLLQEGETPTTSTVSSSDKETPGLDLRRHSMSNPPTTGRFR